MPRLARRRSLGPDDGSPGPVFFDVLGLGMVSLPWWAAVATNLATGLAVVVLVVRDVEVWSKKLELEARLCWTAVVLFLLAEVLALVLAVALCCLLAAVLGVLGLTMAWYSRPGLLVLLYASPSAAALLLLLHKVKILLQSRAGGKLPEEFLQICCQHSGHLLLLLPCLLLTLAGVRSSFLLTITLLSTLTWRLVTSLLHSPRSWCSYLLLQLLLLLPLSLWSYITQLLLTIFLPIMGRRGPAGNPDIILGAGVASLTLLLLHPLLPVLVAIRRQGFLRLLLLLSLLTGLLPLLLGWGFPYSACPLHPAPQRLSVYHVRREVGGRVEAGYLVGRWDHHWSRRLEHQVAAYSSALPVAEEECRRLLGCGLPLHRVRLQDGGGALWINTSVPLPRLAVATVAREVGREGVVGGGTNITLELRGPNLVQLLLCPEEGVRLTAWSLGEQQPKGRGEWWGRQVYHVQLVRGLGAGVQRMWLQLEGPQSSEGKLVTVSVAGHHTSGEGRAGPGLEELEASHPPWVSLAAWTVDYRLEAF